MKAKRSPVWLGWWQILFLILSATWLLAPYLNHTLSARTALISQYEVPGQAFASWFRVADFAGGLLLAAMGYIYLVHWRLKGAGWLLFIIGCGMALDPLFSTNCQFVSGRCVEYHSLGFILHATETVITASGVFLLSCLDGWRRQKALTISFIAIQAVYFGLFLSQYASQARFNTLSQFFYQFLLLIWLAWFGRDRWPGRYQLTDANTVRQNLVKYLFASWAFVNGILAIVISLAHLNLFGRLHGLYFASDTAWLAQHGVFIGVTMLYLSRHLARGERRARQIFLLICLVETLKYSVVAPNPWLTGLYLITCGLLLATTDSFDRGTVALTWRVRTRDFLFMLAGLLVAALAALLLLDRDDRVSKIAYHTFSNFSRYGWAEKLEPRTHLQSILLAHTISAFVIAGLAGLLWALFRPSRVGNHGPADYRRVRQSLNRFSASTEDFFKLWPSDKQYFWSGDSFIAYKLVGANVFALADPVGPKHDQTKLIADFLSWARDHRLRVCFLPVYPGSQALYKRAGLANLQIGSSAVIKTAKFLSETANDKWWRWQKNRAARAGFAYAVAQPPHTADFMAELKVVSDDWLSKDGHKERTFALGYFDQSYLQQCAIHCLRNEQGRLVAFTNQIPVFKKSPTATVDLLRNQTDAAGAMPYLLLKTIESLAAEHAYFDLGFVPFAAVNHPALQVAKILSAGRFSARGLEQFKNKFDPDWQPNYLAYDGDLADLALIALNLESAMDL
jgi:phosphatidylglycerol lysyltransferase